MAKKSQAIAVLEGKLNLLLKEEAAARQALTAAGAQRQTVEDLLKSIRAAVAGSKGGKGKRGGKDVPIRQAVVESFNEQAQAGFNKAQADAVAKETAAQAAKALAALNARGDAAATKAEAATA